ncbi:MAG: hypothetical protein JWM78_3447 [Verrucomicrobiaceae bacterium]|nr:hypothetical protein [Verrucomicrobiaceae bacterium]
MSDAAKAALVVNAERARKMTLVSLVLILLLVAINTLIAPTGGRSANVVVWIALSLPLLVVLPGVLRGGLTSYTWLGFISLLYFAQAVSALFSSASRRYDILQLILSIALFFGALFFVRWRARANRIAETL